MSSILVFLTTLLAAAPAGAEPPPAPSEASMVVWPATRAAEAAARALSDRAADRAAFEVVDAGLVRRRVAAGGRVDVRSFLGEVRRLVSTARLSLSGDPQGALDRLEPALRDFLVDLGTGEGRTTLRDLLVVRARALLARSDPVAAAADATLAVRLDPASGSGIDLTSLLPAERALVDRAVQDSAIAAAGRLSVETEPAGAEVVVDGVVRGRAPLDLELPYGRHVVRVERFGRQPMASIAEVALGETARISLTLAAAEGDDLAEQIAVKVAEGAFDAGSLDALAVLAQALGVRAVIVVHEGAPRFRARLYRDGAWAGEGSADPAGPWDDLLVRLERAALGRTGRTPGQVEPTHETPITGRWWFWTGIGAVVVGGVVTGIVLASQPSPGGSVEWGHR
jgi:hypothetical protein